MWRSKRNHVVGETYALLRVTRRYNACQRFLKSLEDTTRLERIFVSPDVERRAFAILERYRDHGFSFVDATSFAVMRGERVRHDFAFDSHFAIADSRACLSTSESNSSDPSAK